ncbi:MAG: DoxX family protein [Cyclobacteriaceae bacterium]
MKNILFKVPRINPGYGAIFIRLAFGFHLLFYSWGSVIQFNAGSNAEFLSSLGIPFPTVMSWAYVLTEFIGGILLIIGFKVRLVSIPLIITFLVAYFLVHAGDSYENSFQALQMLAVSIFFLVNGAGKFSVDQILEK